jgi:hypothetical protein
LKIENEEFVKSMKSEKWGKFLRHSREGGNPPAFSVSPVSPVSPASPVSPINH